MKHFMCADMMIERHFLCPFHICVNVKSDITWFQPIKCMSSNLYKGMTLLPLKKGRPFFSPWISDIYKNEWNHAIPIVHLRGCRASKESGRHHPCLERRPNWGPPFLETGQCPDQEDPLRESHCWSSSGVGWREGFDATLAPSTLVDLTWIHTEI